MEKRKLAEARNLIQQKEYVKASTLLETMLDNDTAMKWYLQIEQIIESKKTNEDTQDSKRRNNRIVVYIVIIAIFIAVLLILQEQNAQRVCENIRLLGRSC